MATGEEPKRTNDNFDDLLKCTICLEAFKEPTYLPCLHTFCKLCIRTYIDSNKEKKGDNPCPLCRKPVSFADSTEDTDSIVDKLPKNNFVASLIDKQTITERQCNFCNALGKQTRAGFWCGVCEQSYCEECVQCHKSNKLLAMHKLVSIKDIQNKTVDLNETNVVFCDVHQDNIVQVFCVDHNMHKKACCTLCATLSHRKCDHVISIEEAAAGIKQNGDVTSLLSKLEEFETFLADLINCRNENEETFMTEATDIETVVMKMIKGMKEHLDKIQNKILSELEAAKKQTSMKVTDDINDFTSYKSAVKNWKSLLAGVVQRGSEQQCLVILNEIAPKMEKLQDEIKDTTTKIRNTSVRFEVSTFAREFCDKMSTIGDLKFAESKLKYERGKIKLFRTDFRKGDIKVIKTLNVAPSGYTSGIFLDGFMIFAANSTKKVVKFNQNGELLREISVPKEPTDLCHVSEGKVVVSTDTKVLYHVDSKDMTLLKTIKLAYDIPTWGVCGFDNKHLIIGSNHQLTWVDQSSGAKVKSVPTSGYSLYVSSSGNNDYLYGDEINSVSYVVNDKKKFTNSNKQLKEPYGNGIDDEGNFYIAGHGSKNIHQITDTGELIRIIPASSIGLDKPLVVRFQHETNIFLVTCAGSGKASLCCID